MVEFEAVVEGEFVALLDVSEGNDPDLIIDDLRFAVWIAAVVDEFCRVVGDIAVDVVVIVQDEHVDGGVARAFSFISQINGALVPLFRADLLPNVLDDLSIFESSSRRRDLAGEWQSLGACSRGKWSVWEPLLSLPSSWGTWISPSR